MPKLIVCADALPWMREGRTRGAVVTSLPDADEIGRSLPEWRAWFSEAAELCFGITEPAAATVFYQTDRKAEGQTHSKAALVLAAADRAGSRLLWHKIALRRAPGAVDLHRPGYTHLIAFSRNGRPGAATPDVFDAGPRLYPNGMGIKAARLAVSFAGQGSRMILDPFCGRGTIPAVADALGLDAIGVDIDPAQCEAAGRLRLELKRPAQDLPGGPSDAD
jgi:hypothetical protein